ncbi:MAG: hypothetical protein EZS28_023326, partial [Streblomastix strix]
MAQTSDIPESTEDRILPPLKSDSAGSEESKSARGGQAAMKDQTQFYSPQISSERRNLKKADDVNFLTMNFDEDIKRVFSQDYNRRVQLVAQVGKTAEDGANRRIPQYFYKNAESTIELPSSIWKKRNKRLQREENIEQERNRLREQRQETKRMKEINESTERETTPFKFRDFEQNNEPKKINPPLMVTTPTGRVFLTQTRLTSSNQSGTAGSYGNTLSSIPTTNTSTHRSNEQLIQYQNQSSSRFSSPGKYSQRIQTADTTYTNGSNTGLGLTLPAHLKPLNLSQLFVEQLPIQTSQSTQRSQNADNQLQLATVSETEQQQQQSNTSQTSDINVFEMKHRDAEWSKAAFLDHLPTTREELLILESELDKALSQYTQASESDMRIDVLRRVGDEIVRQVTVQSNTRGRLLAKVLNSLLGEGCKVPELSKQMNQLSVLMDLTKAQADEAIKHKEEEIMKIIEQVEIDNRVIEDDLSFLDMKHLVAQMRHEEQILIKERKFAQEQSMKEMQKKEFIQDENFQLHSKVDEMARIILSLRTQLEDKMRQIMKSEKDNMKMHQDKVILEHHLLQRESEINDDIEISVQEALDKDQRRRDSLQREASTDADHSSQYLIDLRAWARDAIGNLPNAMVQTDPFLERLEKMVKNLKEDKQLVDSKIKTKGDESEKKIHDILEQKNKVEEQLKQSRMEMNLLKQQVEESTNMMQKLGQQQKAEIEQSQQARSQLAGQVEALKKQLQIEKGALLTPTQTPRQTDGLSQRDKRRLSQQQATQDKQQAEENKLQAELDKQLADQQQQKELSELLEQQKKGIDYKKRRQERKKKQQQEGNEQEDEEEDEQESLEKEKVDKQRKEEKKKEKQIGEDQQQQQDKPQEGEQVKQQLDKQQQQDKQQQKNIQTSSTDSLETKEYAGFKLEIPNESEIDEEQKQKSSRPSSSKKQIKPSSGAASSKTGGKQSRESSANRTSVIGSASKKTTPTKKDSKDDKMRERKQSKQQQQQQQQQSQSQSQIETVDQQQTQQQQSQLPPLPVKRSIHTLEKGTGTESLEKLIKLAEEKQPTKPQTPFEEFEQKAEIFKGQKLDEAQRKMLNDLATMAYRANFEIDRLHQIITGKPSNESQGMQTESSSEEE